MISPFGRIRIQREIENLNRSDRIVVWIPSYSECPACGFDAKSRAGKNISCSVCGGTGRVVNWATAYLSARVSWTDVGRPRFGGTVTTAELGDATVEVRLLHMTLMEDVRDAEGGYIEIDGRKLRAMSVDANRIEGKTSCVVRCEVIHD